MTGSQPPAMPDGERPGGGSLPAKLEPLVETARAYARAATSKNTNRAYAADWRDYLRWRARQGLDLKALADPECVGLYLAALASGAKGAGGKARTVATIERRLSALAWHFAQRALPFDRKNRHVATVLAGVRRTHGRPPVQKEALLPEHVLAMLDLLPPSNLRNLRDRAILLLGFAGGLRRSEVAGLVMSPEDSLEGTGWPEFFEKGVLLTLRGKTGWREVEIGRGSKDATCPVAALEAWLKFARIVRGPVFRAVVGRAVGAESLNDRHVARLVKRLAVAAGVRGDLSERDREEKFSGHSLRAGLASSAEIDERYVQKHLGHASAEMTRRYQRRRDRFRVNLTKAAGL
jgi:integrase